jgi:hypothetical protein
MPKSKPHSEELVMTQAELPPGIDAPSPQAERDRLIVGSDIPAGVEEDIRQLAHRVGGLSRLRELVNEMELASR